MLKPPRESASASYVSGDLDRQGLGGTPVKRWRWDAGDQGGDDLESGGVTVDKKTKGRWRRCCSCRKGRFRIRACDLVGILALATLIGFVILFSGTGNNRGPAVDDNSAIIENNNEQPMQEGLGRKDAGLSADRPPGEDDGGAAEDDMEMGAGGDVAHADGAAEMDDSLRERILGDVGGGGGGGDRGDAPDEEEEEELKVERPKTAKAKSHGHPKRDRKFLYEEEKLVGVQPVRYVDRQGGS